MYCSKCGKEIRDTDSFCGFCGAKIEKVQVESNSQNYETQINGDEPKNANNNVNYNMLNQNSQNYNSQFTGNNFNSCNNQYSNVNGVKFSQSIFGRIIITYLKKPLSFFEEMKEEDTTKSSIIMLVLTSILYGLFHMTLLRSFFKAIVSKISSSFDGFIGSALKSSIPGSDLADLNKILDMITNNLISDSFNYGECFFKGMLGFLLIILVCFISLQICNSMLLNNSISQKNIILIISFSFIPLLLALLIDNIVIYISIVASLSIYLLGIILSLSTVFGALIKQTEKQIHNRVYFSIVINSIIFVIVIPFVISLTTSSVFNIIKEMFKQLITK